MKSARLVAVLALAMMSACDPQFVYEGSVTDAAGRPVEHAEVALVCDGASQDRTLTDAHGLFRYSRIGAFGDNCAIEVRHGGMKPLDFSIMDHCTCTYIRHTCRHVVLDAKLMN